MAIPDNVGIQLGAGALVLMMLKEIFSFIKYWQRDRENGNGNGNGHGNTGSKSPDFWRSEIRIAQREVIEMMVLPIMEKQTEILDKMNDKVTEIAVVQRQRRND